MQVQIRIFEDVAEILDLEIDCKFIGHGLCIPADIPKPAEAVGIARRLEGYAQPRITSHGLGSQRQALGFIDFIRLGMEAVDMVVSSLDPEKVHPIGHLVGRFHHHNGSPVNICVGISFAGGVHVHYLDPAAVVEMLGRRVGL